MAKAYEAQITQEEFEAFEALVRGTRAVVRASRDALYRLLQDHGDLHGKVGARGYTYEGELTTEDFEELWRQSDKRRPVVKVRRSALEGLLADHKALWEGLEA